MLAAVWGVKTHRPYLHAREFFLHTADHRALLWLLTHKEPVGQRMRWILVLQEYRFTLVHRPGVLNPADVPSREPLGCVADATGARLLDEEQEAWPLPQVLTADYQSDHTCYTHEQLTQALGIQVGLKREPAVSASTMAAVISGDEVFPSRPAAVLAHSTSFIPTAHELSHDLFCVLAASNESPLDGTLPPSLVSLLGGGGTAAHVLAAESSNSQDSASAWQQTQLMRAAAASVTLAEMQLGPNYIPAPSLPGVQLGAADECGVRPTKQLTTTPCADTFFAAAHSDGIVLWEPCGGICAGLEMVLRYGIKVSRYLYSDIYRSNGANYCCTQDYPAYG
jgi:hypothetical protein